MIKVYAQEFINICDYLVKNPSVKKQRGKIIVSRELLEEMLHKNNYQATSEKVRIWKKLGWIDTDEGHLTKRIYEYTSKKYIRMYVLKRDMHEALKEIIRTT